MPDISNPHDAYFKDLLTRVEAAQEIARLYLPAEIVKHLDLESMELVKDTWTDPDRSNTLPMSFTGSSGLVQKRVTARSIFSSCLNTKANPTKRLPFNCCGIWCGNGIVTCKWVLSLCH